MAFKAIFKGHFDFGTTRTYEQVLKMYRWRFENYYKNEVLLKEEDIFREETLSLVIGKLALPCLKKYWRNTYMILDYVAQFAISGQVSIWLVEEGVLKKEFIIDPSGDRKAVLAYKKGVNLSEVGDFEGAIKAFSRSISKYAKHSNAYEGRGQIYLRMEDISNAKKDFQRSIELYFGNPYAHFGMAQIEMQQHQYEKAATHYAACIKHTIPHEPLYWYARYLKGEVHNIIEEHKKAATEFRFFAARQFKPNTPNYLRKRSAYYKWGQSLLKINDGKGALKAFDQMLKIERGEDGLTKGVMHLWRGKARHKIGKKGYQQDWKIAKAEGIKEAVSLLETYC